MLNFEGFCPKCYERVKCKTAQCNKKASIKGVSFEYIGYIATCDVCGTEVSVPAITDFNDMCLEKGYFEEIANRLY